MNLRQMVMQMINRNMNPMLKNIVNMDEASLEKFVRNICKERGIDFDKEFSAFTQRFR